MPPCLPLYPCLSRIRNTHTYLSRPRQMHQLHIHTCYITYPIDLKSPLFTFISHTTFLLNKVWPKNYFRVSTYIQHYKVIWRSTNANFHCMVPTMIFIPHCEFVYFYTIYKVSHNKEKRRASLSPSHTPPCTPLSRMHTKLSPGPLKVSPQKIHTCFIFLSRYMQWRSLYLKRKHDTYIGLQNPLNMVTIYVLWLLYSHGLTVQLCICSRHD